jgi:hypothetical protein
MQIGLKLRMAVLEPTSLQTHFPPQSSNSRVTQPLQHRVVGGGRSDEFHTPGLSAHAYSQHFIYLSEQYDRTCVTPMHLPRTPWRTQRFDDTTMRYTYGSPQSDAHSFEMTLIDRDASGVLLRHATGRYTHKHGKGQLVAACLSSSASELVTLVKFTNLHESQMRIQLLRLRSHARGWLPLKIGFTTTDRSSQPALLAIGPYMDLQASDYVYVLIDHIVRIFSLGSGVQVRLP